MLQFLGNQNWLNVLCGPPYSNIPYISSARDAETERLFKCIADLTRGDVETLRDLRAALWRGHRAEVRDKLAALRRNNSIWPQLPPEIQASALRLQAVLATESGEWDDAERLVSEALRLNPLGNLASIQARIELARFGPEKALSTLAPNSDNVETLCARGALLLVLDKMDEAANVLESVRKPHDVEGLRLLALLSARQGDISKLGVC